MYVNQHRIPTLQSNAPALPYSRYLTIASSHQPFFLTVTCTSPHLVFSFIVYQMISNVFPYLTFGQQIKPEGAVVEPRSSESESGILSTTPLIVSQRQRERSLRSLVLKESPCPFLVLSTSSRNSPEVSDENSINI